MKCDMYKQSVFSIVWLLISESVHKYLDFTKFKYRDLDIILKHHLTLQRT